MEKTIIVGQLSQKSKTLAFKIGVVCFCVFLILFLLNLEKYSHLLRYMTIFDIIIYIILFGYGFNTVSLFFDAALLACIIGILHYVACAKIAITVTPTSANTAAHIVAKPSADRIRTTTLIPIEKTIFCCAITNVLFAILIAV